MRGFSCRTECMLDCAVEGMREAMDGIGRMRSLPMDDVGCGKDVVTLENEKFGGSSLDREDRCGYIAVCCWYCKGS